jgi:CHASE3 domain sensor protein
VSKLKKFALLSSRTGSAVRTDRVVTLLVCAACAVAFTFAAAMAVYANNEHMVDAKEWVEHSHDVLTGIQTQGQRLDRVGSSMQLFQATGEERNLSSAQAAAATMRVGAENLQTLVRDNPSQTQHAKDLDVAIEALSHSLDSTKTSRAIPEREIRESRSALTTLQNEERALLKQRDSETQKTTTHSLLLGVAFLCSSLLAIIVLFGFLIRDALSRRAFEQQLSVANDSLEETVQQLKRHGTDAVFLKSARDELQLCVTSLEAQQCTEGIFWNSFQAAGGRP